MKIARRKAVWGKTFRLWNWKKKKTFELLPLVSGQSQQADRQMHTQQVPCHTHTHKKKRTEVTCVLLSARTGAPPQETREALPRKSRGKGETEGQSCVSIHLRACLQETARGFQWLHSSPLRSTRVLHRLKHEAACRGKSGYIFAAVLINE